MEIKVDQVLDCKGLSCPMPIVRTKKLMDKLEAGRVVEVLATDKGSTADIQSWAKSTGNQYLGTTSEEEVLKHYLRKASDEDVKEETFFPHTVTNEELESRLQDDNILVIDVREPAEYAFNRIPNAVSIPLGDIENRLSDLDASKEIYVICRSGSRSDRAAQLLEENNFNKVKNVLPGMSEWNGPTKGKE